MPTITTKGQRGYVKFWGSKVLTVLGKWQKSSHLLICSKSRMHVLFSSDTTVRTVREYIINKLMQGKHEVINIQLT